MTRRTRTTGLALAALIGLGALSGCSAFNEQRGRGDAPVGSKDDSPTEVVNMPDYFANLATKCNHGNRVYVSTREAAPVVVPNDPSCQG